MWFIFWGFTGFLGVGAVFWDAVGAGLGNLEPWFELGLVVLDGIGLEYFFLLFWA